MASFHLNAVIVKRSQGQSAVAASAYRARIEMENERTGNVYNYSSKASDVLWADVLTPKPSPEWHKDRAALWNDVEKTEKRKDAQLARDIIVAMPHELTTEQQTNILKDFIREQFTRKGYVVDAAMHKPDRRGDQRNVHAHLLVSLRKVNDDGTWGGKEQFDSKKPPAQELAALREAWAKRCNRELERHGHDARIDHRTLEAQGVNRIPTQHVGKTGENMERGGRESDRAENLRRIREAHRLRAQADKIEQEHANANTQALQRSNDDAPQIAQVEKPRAAAVEEQTKTAQSAIDRIRKEDRAEQLASLRSISRTGWATMGDELRGIFSALRSLTATMGAALSDIIKGGDFFLARSRFEHLKALQEKKPAPSKPAAAGTRLGVEAEERLRAKAAIGNEPNKTEPPRNKVDENPAAGRAGRQIEEAEKAQQAAKRQDEGMRTLERMAAERKAAREKAKEDAGAELREELKRARRKNDRGRNGPGI